MKELFRADVCTVYEEEKGLYIIQEETVRSFLVVGSERAALIDTGSGTEEMRQIVEKITEKPVVVLITHVDGDHIHCLGQFEEAWMSPSEYARFHNDTGTNPNLHPIWDGDIFDLGGVKLEAVMILEKHLFQLQRAALAFNKPVKHKIIFSKVVISACIVKNHRELVLCYDPVKLCSFKRFKRIVILIVVVSRFRLIDSILFLHDRTNTP